MGHSTKVRIKTLGQESREMSSSLDSTFNQVCDLGLASNLSGLHVTICEIGGMSLEQ